MQIPRSSFQGAVQIKKQHLLHLLLLGLSIHNSVADYSSKVKVHRLREVTAHLSWCHPPDQSLTHYQISERASFWSRLPPLSKNLKGHLFRNWLVLCLYFFIYEYLQQVIYTEVHRRQFKNIFACAKELFSVLKLVWFTITAYSFHWLHYDMVFIYFECC